MTTTHGTKTNTALTLNQALGKLLVLASTKGLPDFVRVRSFPGVGRALAALDLDVYSAADLAVWHAAIGDETLRPLEHEGRMIYRSVAYNWHGFYITIRAEVGPSTHTPLDVADLNALEAVAA